MIGSCPDTLPFSTMLDFQIPTMSCAHCVRTITEAVQAADPAAKLQADLATHRVQVETTAPAATVVALLTEAGYAPA
jgi:copper chaperone